MRIANPCEVRGGFDSAMETDDPLWRPLMGSSCKERKKRRRRRRRPALLGSGEECIVD